MHPDGSAEFVCKMQQHFLGLCSQNSTHWAKLVLKRRSALYYLFTKDQIPAEDLLSLRVGPVTGSGFHLYEGIVIEVVSVFIPPCRTNTEQGYVWLVTMWPDL